MNEELVLTNSAIKRELIRIINCSPLTANSREQLRELQSDNIDVDSDVFFNEIYVEFDKLNNNDIHNFQENGEYEIEDVFSMRRKSIKKQMDNLGLFEDEIKELNKDIYTIYGFAGSGKTTYMNFLKHKSCGTHSFYVGDFENAEKDCNILDEAIDFSNVWRNKSYKNYWRIISISIEIMDKILEDNIKSNTVENLGGFYKQYFIDKNGYKIKDADEKTEFFKFIIDFTDRDALGRDLKKHFTEKFNLLTDGFIFNNLHLEKYLEYVFDILIRLAFCCKKISNKKQVLVFDNIEYFIMNSANSVHEHVQEEEIEKILNKAHEQSNSFCRNKIDKIATKERGYTPTFALLFCVRDTTEKILNTAIGAVEYNHSEKTESRKADISALCDTIKILQKRFNYFNNHTRAFESHPYYIAYNIVIKDKPQNSKWGLNDLVSNIANGNQRRISHIILESLESCTEEELRLFVELWNDSHKIGKGYLKHICRKFFVRKVLDYIKIKDFFENIIVDDVNYNDHFGSYARKIVTFLYNKFKTKDEYIPIHNLIYALINKPYGGYNTETRNAYIKEFAKIIFNLNQNIEDFDYNASPLVILKYPNSIAYNELNLINEIRNLSNRPLEDEQNEKWGIKIKPHGIAFVNIFPDFEYFACRCENASYLLLERNAYNIKKTIILVKTKAFKCIDTILKRDIDFFSAADAMNEATNFRLLFEPSDNCKYDWLYRNFVGIQIDHPYRILESHVGYLSDYSNYIFYDGRSKLGLSDNDVRSILKCIVIIMDEYQKKLRDLNRNYPNYTKFQSFPKNIFDERKTPTDFEQLLVLD